MNFPTVAQVKAHIRVEIDDEEDDLIQEYIDDAISYIESYINQAYMRMKSRRRKATELFLIRA